MNINSPFEVRTYIATTSSAPIINSNTFHQQYQHTMSFNYIFQQNGHNVHPYYLPLDPNPNDLALATNRFLAYNGWTRTILIRDTSTFYTKFASGLRSSIGLHVKLDDKLRDPQMFENVADVMHSDIRVILVACGNVMAKRVIEQARRANLMDGRWIWILVESAFTSDISHPKKDENQQFPAGILGIKLRKTHLDKVSVRSAVLFFASSINRRLDGGPWTQDVDNRNYTLPVSCFFGPEDKREEFAKFIHKTMLDHRLHNTTTHPPKPTFDIYNLVPRSNHPLPHHVMPHVRKVKPDQLVWKRIGNVTGGRVSLEAVLWPGRHHVGPSKRGRERYRVATAFAPPFVMPATRVENQSCLLGLPCLQVRTHSKTELSRLFADFRGQRVLEGTEYNVSCCAGISMDLMQSLAEDLHFSFDLYLVADGFFGTKRGGKWNGLTRDIASGAAHMTFTAFSLTSERSRAIDYSVPFHHSGVSCLTFTREREVPLSAFLVPFR
ncbi:hypothetical protein JTE90_007130 [Oedothorax gibbosus]|uniref:Ionotropic glutamate receptor L-glutamate and glycine-binding domain-containing protein n=1 Tax=Oedothorax gibbosus TaxID=931172 RepID=A0AAV6VSS9_9ARAC|nr:hypothetical protein JTE90_007130 [Oedothorax gibbosus]